MKRPILFLVALLFAAPALAAGADQAFAQAINSFFDSASGLASMNIFEAEGKWLMGGLLTILISWTGIMSLVSDGGLPEAMAKMVRIILMAGISWFFLQADTQQKLVGGFDYMAAKAAKAAATGAPIQLDKPAQQLSATIGAGLDTALSLWKPIDDANNQDKRDWLDITLNEGPLAFLAGNLGEGIVKALTVALIVLTLAVYGFVIASSLVLVQIGLVCAPILVPWLLWDATAFLFNSWLRFMIVAGLVRLVAALNLSMTWALLDGVKKLANTAGSTAAFDFSAYLAALLLTLLMCFLMLQTFSIASGLVSGLPSIAMPRLPSPGPKPGGGNGNGPSKK